MVTFRIENRPTDRTLLNGFHIAPTFIARPNDSCAEFGSRAIANLVVTALVYPTKLEVVEHEWPPLNQDQLARLYRQVADTGASANLLLWSRALDASRGRALVRPT